MIDVTKITHVGYSLIIEGNSGEEELVIQTCGGQSGHTEIQAIATSCDGGRGTRKRHWDVPYGQLKYGDAKKKLVEIALEWGTSQENAVHISEHLIP